MVRDVIDTVSAIRRLPAPKARKSLLEHEGLVGLLLDRAQDDLGVFRKGAGSVGRNTSPNYHPKTTSPKDGLVERSRARHAGCPFLAAALSQNDL